MKHRTVLTRRLLSWLAVAGTTFAVACGSPAEQASSPASAPAPPTSRPSAVPAATDPAWHYEGAEGPAAWGTLSPKFAACGDGRAQSPIDIADTSAGGGGVTLRIPRAELKIAHHAHVADGINNGHTIQVNYAGGDTLTIGADAYALVQYHFHNPSEHTVKGRHAPMEMHLVHRSAAGALAVVGVFIEEGAPNAAFDPIWANLPKEKGLETHFPSVTVDVDALLPAVRSAWRYDGSLTTPPCSEGVTWIVMSTPIHLGPEQVRAFTDLVHDNNRPTQPLNGRQVVADTVGIR